MTPFNLEKAKAGFPLTTRDGHKVRTLEIKEKSSFPLKVMLESSGTILPFYYDLDGKCNLSHTRDYDLYMDEKAKGYINIYEISPFKYVASSLIYNSRNEAFENKGSAFKYVKTVEIELL